MSSLQVVELLSGLIAIYAGIQIARAKKVPIASEGGIEPLGWLRGWDAIAVGTFSIVLGLVLLAAAFDFIVIT